MFGLYMLLSSAIMSVSVSGISVQLSPVSDIVRDLSGDLFSIRSSDCQTNGCAVNERSAEIVKSGVRQCRCQCSDSHPVFREDHNQCVNQLDCPLVAFIRPHLTEHIPVVSLPVSPGQLIHPGAHLIIGVDSTINHSKQLLCQIESSNAMTPEGWQPISQKDGSQAFELFEDGNHTFLQWLATDSLRRTLHQKLILIGLICSAVESSVETDIYRPCIAMRVGWVPGLGVNKGREGSDPSKADSGHGNYLMIGLCLGLLGIMYVSALMVYMRNKHSSDHIQKNRRITANRMSSDSSDSHTIGDILSINTSNHSTDHSRHFSSPESDSLNHTSGSISPDWTPDLPSIDYNTPNESEDEIPTENSKSDSELKDSQTKSSRNLIYDKIAQKPERIQRLTLRISPELFEPKLLHDPPPTALEMLQKIRDLICIAKTRLRNFRFRPTLVVIPEDDYFYNENSIKNACSGVNGQTQFIVNSITDPFNDNKTSSEELNSRTTVEENHQILSESLPKDNQNIKILDNLSESSSKSVSRKKIINEVQTQFFNDLNYDNKASDTTEKLISGKNLDLECQVTAQTEISPVIHSDLEKRLSSKVEQSFYKTLENQLFDGKKNIDSSDSRMISYFKNSLHRLSSKSKTKSDQVVISPNNWTLQTVSADRRCRQRHMNSKSVIRKRMATRRGQLCYNCSDVSSLSKHKNADLDQKPSLESNENNEITDSLEFYTNSDSEMSTTSSTARDYPFTSLESEVNDNNDHRNSELDMNGDENSPIDECLKYLAAASVDTNAKNHDKYYSRIGRASKGMSAIRKLRSSEWNHVCHRSDSELESSELKSDSRTNFYSKNSKSKNNSSKSLNSHNRQKFKKQLELYKSHSNEALNRSDTSNEDVFNKLEQTLDRVIDQSEGNPNVVDIEIIEENMDQMQCETEDNSSAHFVVKIKI